MEETSKKKEFDASTLKLLKIIAASGKYIIASTVSYGVSGGIPRGALCRGYQVKTNDDKTVFEILKIPGLDEAAEYTLEIGERDVSADFTQEQLTDLYTYVEESRNAMGQKKQEMFSSLLDGITGALIK